MAETGLAGNKRDVVGQVTRRRGPDFVCFGAQKGGTRWLFDQLYAHPDFWMPPIKELHYFNSPSSRKRLAVELKAEAADLDTLNRERAEERLRPLDQRDLDFLDTFLALADQPMDCARYATLFDGKGDAISGDITPGYSALDDERVGLIVEHFADIPYLFMARDPVKRFWSQVCMHVHKDRLNEGMNDKAIVALLSKGSYRKRSYQSEIVARWRRFVPAERLGLFFLDELIADPAALRRRVIAFVGGDPDKPSGDLPANFNRKAGKSAMPMPERLKSMVAERLAEEIRACAATLGGPAENWPGLYGL